MALLRSIADIRDEEVTMLLRGGDPRGGIAPFRPEEKRANYRAAACRSLDDPAIRALDGRSPDGVPIRTYYPPTMRRNSSRVLYLHGGGFISGDLDTHDPLCRLLAARVGAEIVAVDYRLAPEHPYPAAVDDCFSVLCWLAEKDSSRPLTVAGDSAGGNLAAIMALRARRMKLPLASQVLIYPMLDALLTSPSLVENALVPPFTLLDCVQVWQSYLGDSHIDRGSPDVSPLHEPDLGGLAPAMVITAGLDILTGEGTSYVQRLRQSGVTVRHQHFPQMVHGFLQWTRHVAVARECLDGVVDFLRNG